jgi:broad specificity phosphatase PhoE
MGDINLRSWDEFPALYAKWILHETDLPYPNGECGADVWTRCKRVIDEAFGEGYGRITIFCHGGTIRSIICGILDIPQYKRFLFGAPPHNCSISKVRYEKENSALLVFNEYSHLEAE